ncbi:class I SAM-dependent methyltransferase [Pseudofrankia inefficax]|uniref:Methyltransferase type 11 n=1 Tax=Pseudofrankia inefficax (strain DSM 45817 / CECT 9037 / DDB 130130 / EuI1c) TaxID=298654 RepID=E3IW21_PSEI1|nr:class I SAM-dependent methyltransferase [Pseudofrankia inefficax]ADP84949.1 Methyltransferase type 11 [Pseudofrankia inefficax]
MGFYDDQVVPRLTDVALGRPMEEIRARVTAGLAGEVLEIGFGSGRNLPHLPAAVTRLLVVEPAAVGRALAAPRIAAVSFPVEFIGDDGQALPVADASVDHVLSTWTLCTIPDAEQALREIYRVLRPGGTMHFTEHGRSPSPRAARWQNRLNPAWGRFAGGCHLNRQIDELVEQSGLTLKSVQTYPMGGTALLGFAYEGIASKPG